MIYYDYYYQYMCNICNILATSCILSSSKLILLVKSFYFKTDILFFIHSYTHTSFHLLSTGYFYNIHTYVHTYIHTRILTYINEYLHTYIHTYLISSTCYILEFIILISIINKRESDIRNFQWQEQTDRVSLFWYLIINYTDSVNTIHTDRQSKHYTYIHIDSKHYTYRQTSWIHKYSLHTYI